MSLEASIAAWAAALPPIDKLVLLCLADHADGEGLCWPSITRIGVRCALHRRTVLRAIQAIIAAGHAELHRVPGRSNRYRLRQIQTGGTAPLVADNHQWRTAPSGAEPQDPWPTATTLVADGHSNLPEKLLITSQHSGRPKRRTLYTQPPPFHAEVIAAYHEICQELPRVVAWSRQRRESLDARIAECKARDKPADTIAYWRSFFGTVAASDFLCGRSKDFRADLPWLLRPENFLKVVEGRYSPVRPPSIGARCHG